MSTRRWPRCSTDSHQDGLDVPRVFRSCPPAAPGGTHVATHAQPHTSQPHRLIGADPVGDLGLFSRSWLRSGPVLADFGASRMIELPILCRQVGGICPCSRGCVGSALGLGDFRVSRSLQPMLADSRLCFALRVERVEVAPQELDPFRPRRSRDVVHRHKVVFGISGSDDSRPPF